MLRKILGAVLGILTTVVLSFGGYLIWRIDVADTRQAENDRIVARLQSDLKAAVEKTNEARDSAQDGRLAAIEQSNEFRDSAQDVRIAEVIAAVKLTGSRLWKLKAWAENQVNLIREKTGMGVTPPADLNPDR